MTDLNDKFSITFTGDIFPADKAFTIGFGIKSQIGKRFDIWKSDFIEVLYHSRFVIGNLEGPIVCDEEVIHNTFYGHPMFGRLLKESGFRIMNLANNHILEQGEHGFHSTLNVLEECGIDVVGGATNNGASKVLIEEIEGVRIAFAGFCDERVCHIPNRGQYASLSEEKIDDAIQEMNAMEADIKVAILHWGNEYIHYPSLQQRALAHKIIDQGVDLIIGHHSHCIQPYENYRNGHILYSLGNFCFDDLQSQLVSIGMLAEVEISQKRINRIILHGLQLFDPTFSKHLVKRIPEEKFKKIYNPKYEKYLKYCQLPNNLYIRNYHRDQKRNRFIQRILKRVILIKKVLLTDFPRKKAILKNIYDFYR